jgi:two-component system chemotaxis response regulator CheB
MSGIEVVALVASAGGLDALGAIVGRLPPEFPAAVLVQQRLGGNGMALVDLLDRETELDVSWVGLGTRLEPGRVLVCPPGAQLQVLPDGACSLTATQGNGLDRPFDALFASLADSFGERALGVVLTGRSTDAAAGTRALRAAGATVLAQSENSAEHATMPRAAVEAGAGPSLGLEAIARALLEAAQQRPDERERA